MPYVRELDDLPWEVRRGASAVLRYWPKVDGRNVLASAAAGHCTYEVVSPSGATVQAEINITPTTVSGVSLLDLAIPAITELGERYQVRITYRESGGSVSYTDLRTFDVVLFPFGQPWVSFNDLVEARQDAADILNRIGVQLGYTTGTEAREYAAAICAIEGRIALDARIRDTVLSDYARAASETRSPAALSRLGRRFCRPALIIDRQRLTRVERFGALAHLYRSVALRPQDGEDAASQVYREFKGLADHAWSQVGPLAYDSSEDGVPDEIIAEVTRVGRMRRVQS